MNPKSYQFVALALCLLFLQGCLNKQKLLDFPEAENQVVTSDGRHFVTSGKGLAEISIRNKEYQLDFIDAGCKSYSGIDYLNGWLFVICVDGSLINGKNKLLAAKLKQGELPKFSSLADLNPLTLPNGLAISPSDNSLFIADFVLLGRGSVAKYELRFSNGVPSVSLINSEFLSVESNVYSPNGLKINGDWLYLTDFDVSSFQSRLLKINLEYDSAEEAEVLFEKNTIFEDLLPTCGGVLVADYLNGRLIFVNSESESYQSEFQEFPGVSSVRWGRAPLFESDKHLIVTERGIIQDGITDIGNQITSVPVSGLLKREVGADCSI